MDCDGIAERQEAIAELRGTLDLREEWASLGKSTLEQVSSSAVSSWARGRAIVFPAHLRALAIALPICLIVLALFAYAGAFGHYWIWIVGVPIGLETLLAAFLLRRTRAVTANLIVPSSELGLLVPLLEQLHAETFKSPLLKSLQSHLTADSGNPIRQISCTRSYTVANPRPVPRPGFLVVKKHSNMCLRVS